MTKTKAALLDKSAFLGSDSRRYVERNIDGFGRIRIRSLKTSEYARIDGMLTRAATALVGKKKAEGTRMLLDAKIALITSCLVDADNKPLLTKDDADNLREMDHAILSALEQACNEHTGVEGLDVEAAAKN